MQLDFTGTIIFWRGPAPWFYVPVPAPQSAQIQAISNLVTYGWGVIPVRVRIGSTKFETSLFPKDGLYLLPLKVSVRKAEHLDLGDEVRVHLEIR